MWHKLKYVQRVLDRKQFPLRTYSNGSPTPPRKDSLIIYQRSSQLDAGHVAVIVDVVPGYIRVAEQNYYYQFWSSNYAREIPLNFSNGRYYIRDRFNIYGWMEVQDNNQLKPLDDATIEEIEARRASSG